MSDSVLSSDRGAWVEVTLNRPDKLNCFNREMHLALRAALEAALSDGKRAILLTGAGRGFCAGQDLSEPDFAQADEGAGPRDLGQALEELYNPLVRIIQNAELPVVCAVNGVAAGAGANVALACDIVLASETASFVQAFVKIGLVPDVGGTWNLVHSVGLARAKALTLTGTPITAQQAADWGMIWQVLPAAALLEAARRLTAELAEGPTRALALTKKALHAAVTHSLSEQLAIEAEAQKACGETEDHAEGLAAFLAKRAPLFKGK